MKRGPAIFTIGHGNRALEEFIELLQEARIECLVDVRAYPASRRHPQFAREAVERSLLDAGVRFIPVAHLIVPGKIQTQELSKLARNDRGELVYDVGEQQTLDPYRGEIGIFDQSGGHRIGNVGSNPAGRANKTWICITQPLFLWSASYLFATVGIGRHALQAPRSIDEVNGIRCKGRATTARAWQVAIASSSAERCDGSVISSRT